jgi:hypothetical protein
MLVGLATDAACSSKSRFVVRAEAVHRDFERWCGVFQQTWRLIPLRSGGITNGFATTQFGVNRPIVGLSCGCETRHGSNTLDQTLGFEAELT